MKYAFGLFSLLCAVCAVLAIGDQLYQPREAIGEANRWFVGLAVVLAILYLLSSQTWDHSGSRRGDHSYSRRWDHFDDSRR